MSDDLIKRSDVIKAMRDALVAAEIPYAVNALFKVPSADRPQGTWFKDDEGTFICSACGSGYKDQPTIMGKPMFEWCPICGAEGVRHALRIDIQSRRWEYVKGADDE